MHGKIAVRIFFAALVSIVSLIAIKYTASEMLAGKPKALEKFEKTFDDTVTAVLVVVMTAVLTWATKVASEAKPAPPIGESIAGPIQPQAIPFPQSNQERGRIQQLETCVARYEHEYQRLIARYHRLAAMNERIKSFARGKLATSHAAVVAMFFAFLWPVTAAAEKAIYGQINFNNDQPPPLSIGNFLLAYLQTEVLVLIAALLCLIAYRKFIRKTRSLNFNHALTIGFVGLSMAGLVSILLLSPRMWSDYFAGGGLENANYLDQIPGIPPIKRFVFVGIQKLLLFPTAGLFACLFYRRFFGPSVVSVK